MALVRMATECACGTSSDGNRVCIWHWFGWQQSVYVALVRMATECVCGTGSDGNRVCMWHWFGWQQSVYVALVPMATECVCGIGSDVVFFLFPASDQSHIMVLCVFRVYIIIYMTVDEC